MRVEVLFFAVLRERTGQTQRAVELPESATVASLFDQLVAEFPAIAPLRGRIQIAVNRQVVRADHPLASGDEVALIPPVSGGSDPRRFAITDAPLSLDEVSAAVAGPSQGGLVTFTGHVRRAGAVPDVIRLEYEAYVPMATEVLAAIAREIEENIPGSRLAIHHRVGALSVGEAAVVIAASAPHRAEAFAACREAIEQLKVRAPIWKKEIGESGAVWVGVGP
ncbi:MAG TPA: molybdopterin converting factor subunit 1 [Polyangia bacterium]